MSSAGATGPATPHPVLMLAHNALRLTQHAVWSVLYQDVPVQLLVVDNDSTDGTWAWLNGLGMPNVHTVSFRPQKGVSAGWNWGLMELFEYGGAEHVLVVNNDVELPQDFYRQLLARLPECPWLITGVSVDDRGVVRGATGAAGDATRGGPQESPGAPAALPLAPCPDFSAFVVTRACWRALRLTVAGGQLFDERMMHYASDNDLHVRAHRAGIALMNAGVPFYHERSSTLRTASAAEREAIEAQANADRAVFRAKWGCGPWEPEYAGLFRR